MKNKNLILVLILLIVLFGLAFYFSFKKPQKSKLEVSEKEALLILKAGQSERWFVGEVVEGMTIADAILASALPANLQVKVNSTLEAIGDFQNNNEKRWKCYLNGKEITQKLDQVEIRPQDKILCEYK